MEVDDAGGGGAEDEFRGCAVAGREGEGEEVREAGEVVFFEGAKASVEIHRPRRMDYRRRSFR